MPTLVELHPEELLDREVEGTITRDERARLDAHAEKCGACRFERSARVDFADDLAAPPPLVAGALAGALGAVAKQSVRPPAIVDVDSKAENAAPPSRGRARRVALLWGLAAALFVAFGAASTAVHVLTASRPVEVAPPPTVASVVAAPIAKTKRTVGVRPIDDAAENDQPAEVADAVTIDVAPRPVTTDVAPLVVPRTVLATSAPVVQPQANSAAECASLFAEANAARRGGDVDRALLLYRRIESRYPESDEAKVARAAAGRLLLREGDAKGALDSFDAYLDKSPGAQTHPLDEEAMLGRAHALQHLGHAREEAAAWNELLRTHPDSVHAAEAKARLAALSPDAVAPLPVEETPGRAHRRARARFRRRARGSRFRL